METYKKFPKAIAKLPDEYAEFSFISLVSPPMQTFFLSLGISILESLVRLNHSPMANLVWKNLKNLTRKTLNLANKFGLETESCVFENLIDWLACNDRYDALDCLSLYMKENRHLSAKSVLVAIKLIYHYYHPNNDIFSRKTNLNLDEACDFLNIFCADLGITLYILAMTRSVLISNKALLPTPVAYLYYNPKAIQ